MSNILKLKKCEHKRFEIDEMFNGFYNPFSKKFTLLSIRFGEADPQEYEAIQFIGTCHVCKDKVTRITKVSNLTKVRFCGDIVSVLSNGQISIRSHLRNKRRDDMKKKRETKSAVNASVRRLMKKY